MEKSNIVYINHSHFQFPKIDSHLPS